MPREIVPMRAMAVALGALEGGVVGVVVKTQFDGVADPVWVNLAVALVAGAPAFANMVSLWVSGLAEGRDKTAWVSVTDGADRGLPDRHGAGAEQRFRAGADHRWR
jgi:uncharacterized membrane protein YbhN (UPF0104 family)